MFTEKWKNDAYRKTLLFLFFIVLFLFFMFKNIDIAITLFVSIVFACSLNPLVDKLEEKKIKRPLGAAIVLFGALAILLFLLVYVSVLGIYQIGSFVQAFPKYLNNLEELIKSLPLLKTLQISQINANSFISSVASSSSGLINGAMGFLNGMGSGIVYFLTSLIFIFFLIKDKESIKKTILNYFPLNVRKKSEEIINSISQKIGGYIVAQTVAILSVWLVVTVGLSIFHIEYAISFGIIAGIFDIIPVVGPAIALLICLVASYEFGMKSVIIVTVVFVIAQLLENNFVRPYAYGKLMNLHPIVMFLSLILGAKYLGFIGVLFAPAIASAIIVLLNELYVKNIE